MRGARSEPAQVALAGSNTKCEHHGEEMLPDSGPGKKSPVAAIAWAERRQELAGWTWQHLVNRTDVWGGYRALEEVGREYRKADGTLGKLGSQTTRYGRLTPARLARHFRGGARYNLVGLHSTGTDNTSRWGAVDVDWHGPTSTAPEVNLRAALGWYDRLAGMQFHPLLTDSNGCGGFHLGLLLAEPVPTPRIYHLMQQLVADHAQYGMSATPETFPKQPVVRPRPDGRPGLGNWLRLPGQHHTREHWSRVWDGTRWLDGHTALNHILSLRGDPAPLVPEVPVPDQATRRSHFGCARSSPGYTGNLSAKIAAYMARLPNLGEGQGRDDVAYRFACWLVRDLALDDEVALAWLTRWDAGNNPPKGEARLREILADAHRYGRSTVGCGLEPLPSGNVRPTRKPGHSTISFTVEVQG